jgi:hypothetical protein
MNTMMPRLIKPVPPQLAGYFRPNRHDHKRLADFLSAGAHAALEGLIFDPVLDGLHQELYAEVQERQIEAVLDTRAMELAMPGGFTDALSKLPWASSQTHLPRDFIRERGRQFVDAIVQWVKERHLSAVLAPTHFLIDGADDSWLPVDRDLTFILRDGLDAAGLGDIPIYYPLATRSNFFLSQRHRELFRDALTPLPIDAIWLRVHPFGSRSTGRAVRNYIRACSTLHPLALPIVAEKTGTTGLALLAFGAVTGIESGITLGEHFDANALLNPRVNGKPFAHEARVYIRELQTFLLRDRARKFFSNRTARAYFGCKDDRCCRDGADDMLAEPKRHFMRQRLVEIARLSEIPETLRSSRYMEEMLRRASDRVLMAMDFDSAFEPARQRLQSLRTTLTTVLEEGVQSTCSAVPEGKRIRIRRGA